MLIHIREGILGDKITRNMKKILNLIVVTLLIISVLSTFFVGMGEAESNPELQSNGATEISDWTDLNDIRNDLTGDYVLVNDLNENTAGYETYVNTTNGWDPIGGLEGTFDGQGYTIHDLYINRTSLNNVGLFGYSDFSGSISNITLDNVNITGNLRVGTLVGSNDGNVNNSHSSGEVSGADWVGGLIGTTGGSIENSSSDCSVTGTGGNNAGGLVGRTTSTISKSFSTGTVKGKSGKHNTGGLLGYNFGGTVENSYSTAAVDGDDKVGGLIGDNEGSVSYSYAAGSVTGSTNLGGLIGEDTGTVSNSYWDTDTSGQGSSAGGTGLTTSEMTGSSATSNMAGFDFTNTWDVVDDTSTTGSYPFLLSNTQEAAPGLFADGDGSSSDPCQIEDWDHLTNIRARLGLNYTLVNNIDENSAGYDDYASSNADSGNGWMPIGDNDPKFNGDFDGNSNTIADLFIDRAGEQAIGLFGSTDFDTRISNLSLTNVDITGDTYVGSLIGSTSGYIENCSADGNLVGTEGTWTSENIGGLVGMAIAGEITESYANVDVTGTPSVGVGGFVGTISSSTVRNCYSLGDVVGDTNVGGFVGENKEEIYTSYSNGSVSGNSEVGGFVGNDSSGSGSTFDSYWDTETSGLGTSEGGTGLTTSQMTGARSEDFMDGFDFTNTWNYVSDPDTVSYPYLVNNQQSPEPGLQSRYSGGDGSEATPYQIENWYDLDDVRENKDSNFILKSDLSENTQGYDAVASDTADNGNGFDPIGENEDGNRFTGDFEGDRHTISDMVIDRSSDAVGLFGSIDSSSTIMNITLKDSSLIGDYVGGLVGYNYGTIRNSSVTTSTITGNMYAGGLVGRNDGWNGVGKLIASYSTANVEGSNYIGGLIGDSYHGTVKNSYATGVVSTSSSSITSMGGLIGTNNGTVDTSYATGAVKHSGTKVGGLIGENFDTLSTVSNSYWDEYSTGQEDTNDGDDDSGTGLTTSEMLGDAAQTNMVGFDFTNTWDVYDDSNQVSYPYLTNNPQSPYPGIQPIFAGGSGNTAHPYEISNWTHMNNVRENLGANFTLIADLDQNTDGYSEYVDTAEGWMPIGDDTDSTTRFTGTFDGDNYTISDLEMDRNVEYAGFFGSIGSLGNVTDVHLIDVNITNERAAGALVGIHWGTIKRCSASGNVTVTSSGTYNAGGLVSEMYHASITESYANVTVSSNYYSGGFVGYIGHNTIENSYALGDVDGGSGNAGGFVGYAGYGTIKNSYSTGSVTADGDTGGFSAGIMSADIIDSYWDTDTSGVVTTFGDATGLTTAEMTGSSATSNMAGFDFTGTWNTVESSDPDAAGDGYPILQNLDRTSQLEAQDNKNDYIEITSLPSSITAGDSFSLEITVYDGNDDPITNQWFSDLSIDSEYDGQVIYTSSFQTASDGTYTVSIAPDKVTTADPSHTLTASADGLNPGSDTLTVNHGSATGLTVTPSSPTITAGESQDYYATAEDDYGNTWNATSGTTWEDFIGQNSSWSGNTITVTESSDTSFAIRGTYNSIEDNVLLYVDPAAPYKLVYDQQPADATAGEIMNTVTIKIYDEYDNFVDTATNDVTLSVETGSGTLSGTTTVSASSGVATFDDLYIEEADTYTLNATSDGLENNISDSFTIEPSSKHKLVFDQQPTDTTAGVVINPDITVEIQDEYGNVNESATDEVTLSVSSGSGTLSGTTTVSASSGVATFNDISIEEADTYTLQATATGLNSNTSDSFVIKPAAVSQYVFTSVPDPVTAGEEVSFDIEARDEYDNLNTSYSGTAQISTDANADIDQVSQAFTSGTATFTTSDLTTSEASQSLYAEDDTDASITGTSSSFTVEPAEATQYVMWTYPSTVTAGQEESFEFEARDSYGNVDTNYTGTALVSTWENDDIVDAELTFSDGTATFTTSNLVTAVTDQKFDLDEQSGSLSDTTTPFDVVHASGYKLVFDQQPTDTTAGEKISPAITVQIQDEYGNLVDTATDEVTLEVETGEGTLNGTTTVSAVSGVASFDDLDIETADDYTLNASASGLEYDISNSFTIKPASAQKLVFGQQPTDTTAGEIISPAVTVQVQDEYGNVNTSATDEVSLYVAGPDLYGETHVNAVSGIATFDDLYMETTGSYEIQASASGLSSDTSNTFTITAAPVDYLSIDTTPGQSTAGQETGEFVVNRYDEFGNLNTSGSFTFDLGTTSSGPWEFRDTSSGANTTELTIPDGSSSQNFFYYDEKAGDHTISVSATGVTGDSVVHEVQPAAASYLSFFTTPGASTAGQESGEFIVGVRDEYGNEVTDGEWNITLSSGSGGPYEIRNNTGGASVTEIPILDGQSSQDFYYYDELAGDHTITVNNNSLISNSTTHTVEPASVYEYEITGAPSTVTAGDSVSINLDALDQYGNLVTDYNGDAQIQTTQNSDVSTTQSFSNGEATFTTTNIITAVSGQELYAEDVGDSTVNGTSTSFEVIADSADYLEITDIPNSVMSGATFEIDVTAYDQYDNPAVGQTINGLYIESDVDGTILSTMDVTLDGSGTYTATIEEGNLTSRGTHDITADATGITSDSTTLTVKGYTITIEQPDYPEAAQTITYDDAYITNALPIIFKEDYGTIIDLNTTAADGWEFSYWSAVNSTGEELDYWADTTYEVGLDDVTITPNYNRLYNYLNISASEGEGSVSYNGNDFTDALPVTIMEGQYNTVNLTATADTGWTFSHWTVDGSHYSDSSSIEFEMTSDMNVQAHFDQLYDLTVSVDGNGTVTKPGIGTYSYVEGTVVDIEAVADAHNHFVEWTGDTGTIASTTSNATTITMDSNFMITADFEIDTHTLTIESPENGTMDAPTVGTHTYDYGTVVDIEALPDTECHFVEWTGDIGTIADTGSNDTTITIEGDYTIKAVFAVNTYDLTIDSDVNGQVDSPGEGTFTYEYGTNVNLNAIADSGYYFDEWTGDNGTIDNKYMEDTTITIDGDKTITATFKPIVYDITNWEELYYMRNDMVSGTSYRLMNDLDSETEGYDEYVDTEKGWNPVGNSINEFGADFDGQNHTINDLYINRPDEDYIGLFGATNYGSIKNLDLLNIDIEGDDQVGGLIGMSGTNSDDFTIRNVRVTGQITASGQNTGGMIGYNVKNSIYSSSADVTVNSPGLANVGGLVGYHRGGLIKDSYAEGDVTGDTSDVGGLVGENKGTIENSYATGDVTGGDWVGGLVGENSEQAFEGMIKNSYATGDVDGDSFVGGLVGSNVDVEINASYSNGTVTGDSDVGGLVGNNTGTVSNSFWDILTSGTTESDGGTGKTTSEMQSLATFTDTGTSGLDTAWDFFGDPYDDTGENEIWGISGTANNGYPVFNRNYNFLVMKQNGNGTIKVDGVEPMIPFMKAYGAGDTVSIEGIADSGWHFSEWIGDNSTITDTRANETTITVDGDYVITGEFGKNYALSFDGVDDYVEVQNNSSIDITENMTISFWLNYNDGKIIISKRSSEQPREWIFYEHQGSMTWWYNQNYIRNESVSIPDGWNHYVGIYDSSNSELRLYQNNELIATKIGVTSLQTNNENLFFGYSPYQNWYLDGALDDVRIFNRVLDINEIQDLYENKYVVLGDETALWPMNEGSGPIIYDQSNNESDGTIHGATWVDLSDSELPSSTNLNSADSDAIDSDTNNKWYIISKSTAMSVSVAITLILLSISTIIWIYRRKQKQ